MKNNDSLIAPELKWLYREIWIWRAGALAMILFFATIEILKWKQLTDHNRETRAFEVGVQLNQVAMANALTRIEKSVNNNREAIATVDNHLFQCSGCHSHPKLTGWLRRE